MTATVTCEFVIIVDEDGNYVVSSDEDSAIETANEDDFTSVRSMIRITLDVPAPKAIEITAELPKSESGEYSLAIKETA